MSGQHSIAGAILPNSLVCIMRIAVDLDNDLQTFWYNGTQVYSGSWTQQFPNQQVPGILNIGSIDLFANGATAVYYDNIQIAPATP